MAKPTMHGVEPNRAGEKILLAVEKQLAENNPPQVAWTLERLLAEGIMREDALKYIACALSIEIFEVLKHGATYDEARYLRNLARLPELPWDSETRDLTSRSSRRR